MPFQRVFFETKVPTPHPTEVLYRQPVVLYAAKVDPTPYHISRTTTPPPLERQEGKTADACEDAHAPCAQQDPLTPSQSAPASSPQLPAPEESPPKKKRLHTKQEPTRYSKALQERLVRSERYLIKRLKL